MKIRFSELKSGSSDRAGELKSYEYDSAEIIIGRGGKSQIILTDRSVSLEHAAFFEANNKLCIKDLNSLSGIRVNGQPQKNIGLDSEDVISIGNFDIKGRFESGIWVLVAEKHEKIEIENVQSLHSKLQIQSFMPSVLTLSLLSICLVLIFYLIRPMMRSEAVETYSIGKLTPHHAFLGKDCSACHATSFKPASDAACIDCHSVTDHFDLKKFPKELFPNHNLAKGKPCISCHLEHKGEVTSENKLLCTSCHASMESVRDTTIQNVVSWKSHPDFKSIKDIGTLKLNHAVHLKPDIEGDKGRETLQCSSCHILDAGGKKMKEISYKDNCARCHTLEFDERLPDVQVPHGKEEEVINFLQATYAEFALRDKTTFTKSSSLKLKKGVSLESPAFIKSAVMEEVRNAEELLFIKTGCQLCHEITESSLSDEKNLKSKYKISDVSIKSVWYDKAIFAHEPHQQVACTTCHASSTTSEKSSDILMPGIKECKDCHASSNELSNCMKCHSFHESLPNPPRSKR